MLKHQGIIKRNTDGKLQLIEEDLIIEKFEENDLIERTLEKRGFNQEFVQNQIEKRKELNRLYISDASDVVKNPSLGLDGFFSRYKIKYINQNNDIKYIDYSSEDSNMKRTLFENEVFDDMGNITQTTISGLADKIVINETEFKDLSFSQQSNVIQDINQVVFGSKDKRVVRKISIVNGSILEDPKGDVMQDNPVFRFFRGLGLDYAIFDNNVVRTELDQGGNFVERTYNILSTEDIPSNLRKKIIDVRQSVYEQLQGITISPTQQQVLNYNEGDRGDASLLVDENLAAPNETGLKKLDIYDSMDSIVIKTTDMEKIVNEFNRFFEDHYEKLDGSTQKAIKLIKDAFDKTENPLFYDEDKIELAMRYLVLEVGYKSNSNDLLDLAKNI